MPKTTQLKCFFGCVIDGPLHRFPKWEYPHTEKFEQWKSVLDSANQERGNNYIYNSIRICHRHFEDYFKSPSRRLTGNAVPTLNLTLPRNVESTQPQPFKEVVPITSGTLQLEAEPTTLPSENYYYLAKEHSYNRKRHYDHTYSQEPLKEIQPTASNSSEFPEQSSPHCTQTSQNSEIQATAFTSRDFSEQCLPEYTQSSHDSEVIASSSCDFRTLPQVPQNLPTTQSSQDSEFIASSLCETQQKVLVETLPQFTQNLPANPDSEIQATAFTSRAFPEQCLPEYTQISHDSELIASSLCETNQKVLVETLPQYTQNLSANPDSEIQGTAFTFSEFPEQYFLEYTQNSQESEIQATAFTSREFPEQCLPEYTQISHDSEREMINTDDQSIDAGFLFKVSDVEACRICLATDVKLFSLQDTLLGNCMKTIAGFSTSSCGGLPNFVCYECAPILLKCAKLIEKSKTAEATLLSIIAKNGLITKTLIEQEKTSQANLKSSLDSYLLLNYYYIKYDDDNRTSEYIQSESDPHTQMETKNVGIEHEVGANETADQDDISVVEVQAEIPMVEVDTSDGEANEEYISLVPHRTNEKLEKCAKGISSKFQRKPKRTNLRKRIRLYKMQEFQDISQHFTTVKIPINEQKQAWRDNMVMKCIETGREFICSVCQRTFQTENSLNAHSQNHTSNLGGVRCDVCLVGFPDEAAMWYHTERTHAYRFNCKYCRMVLNNLDDAKYHKNFVCNGSGIKRSRRLQPSS